MMKNKFSSIINQFIGNKLFQQEDKWAWKLKRVALSAPILYWKLICV